MQNVSMSHFCEKDLHWERVRALPSFWTCRHHTDVNRKLPHILLPANVSMCWKAIAFLMLPLISYTSLCKHSGEGLSQTFEAVQLYVELPTPPRGWHHYLWNPCLAPLLVLNWWARPVASFHCCKSLWGTCMKYSATRSAVGFHGTLSHVQTILIQKHHSALLSRGRFL